MSYLETHIFVVREFLYERIHSSPIHISEHMFRIILLFILHMFGRKRACKEWNLLLYPCTEDAVMYGTVSIIIFQLIRDL